MSFYSFGTVFVQFVDRGTFGCGCFLVVSSLVANVFLLGAALVVPSEAEDPASASTSTTEYCRLLAALGDILIRI